MRRVVELLGDARGPVAIAVVLGSAQALLLVPIAAIVEHLFDEQLPPGGSGSVVVSGLLMMALYAGSAGVGILARLLIVRVVRDVGARLRRALLTQLYALPPSWHDRQAAGRLHALLVIDSERVEQLVQTIASPILPALATGVALALVAAFVSPLLTAVVLVAAPPVAALILILSRRSRARTREWQNAYRDFSADTQLALRMLRLSVLEGTEEQEVERRGRQVSELSRARAASQWAQSINSQVYVALAAVLGVLVLVVGGSAVHRGSMKLGELLAFYAVVTLIMRQVTVLGPALSNVAGSFDSLNRIFGLLELRERTPYAGKGQLTFSGAMRVDGVEFGYDQHRVLNGIELDVSAGEHVVLLGPNGSGKSTLGNLLLGLYRPDAGRVLADGTAFDELDLVHLRRQIGVVAQNPVIFLGTVRDNIAYADPGADPAAVRRAAELATAAAFIEELDDGYDAWIEDEGESLSGGQRQRIALARALLGDPALLILDEPTTHLDDAAIRTLLDNLVSMERRPTLIIITHDPAVAVWADRVVHLRDGRIAEIETPAGRRSATA
jgi:ABC-type multidrug transport system fused ATPase/permease subunit